MWTCPQCNRKFENTNQVHSCNEKDLADFLAGKSEHTIGLFYHLVNEFQQIGDVRIYPTKSMIAFGARVNFAYVTQLGKNFIDLVMPFKQPYEDNLCFTKIKQVPGTDDYNHYFRMYFVEDVNEEVRKYLKLSLTPALSKGEGVKKQGFETADVRLWEILKENSKTNRQNPTQAESILWQLLRNNQIGYKIRRQHAIDGYIADFVCLSKGLVIEVDGGYHLLTQEQDELRTFALKSEGFDVIRFTNNEVITNTQKVISAIHQKLTTQPNRIINSPTGR